MTKRNFSVSVLFLLLLFFVVTNTALSASKGIGFGGKIVAVEVKNVECDGGATLVVLGKNISNLAGAFMPSSITPPKERSDGEKIVNKVNKTTQVYNSVPFLITGIGDRPEKGDGILGRAEVGPTFSACKIKIGDRELPFPVRKVIKYGLSTKR